MRKFKFVNALLIFSLIVTFLLPVTSVGAENATPKLAPQLESKLAPKASVSVTNDTYPTCDVYGDPTCDTYEFDYIGLYSAGAQDTTLSVNFYHIGTEDVAGLEFEIFLNGVLDNTIPYADDITYNFEGLTPDTEYEVEVRLVSGGEVIASAIETFSTFPVPTYFNDAALEVMVKQNLNIWDRPLEQSDLVNLEYLYAYGVGIQSLAGLEEATNLDNLELAGNQISDLSPLANLTNLTSVGLSMNPITDLSPLTNLTNLQHLGLGGIELADFSAVGTLTNLVFLDISLTNLSDISFVSNLKNLVDLYIYGNNITDISPLNGLNQLNSVVLSENNISDISVLQNLSALEYVYLDMNPLSDASLEIMEALKANGVYVYFDNYEEEIPVFEWVYYNNKWYYEDQFGNYHTGWAEIGSVWYYFNADGSMAENKWVQSGSAWYYLGKGGKMLTNS
ncbi:leucine-rich repeat domain-containing protein, partial [Bacillus sp. JJ1566]|uniref:leucine-rich repeat domain-containing protein n=1 Tax=Bacillus sp. JJ1566 TaxID=3122961 RepID=UPI002FFE12F4